MGQVVGYKAMTMAIEKPKSMAWVWLSPEIPAIMVSPDITPPWLPTRHDRYYRHQRPPLYRTYLRCGKYAGNQSPYFRYAYDEEFPFVLDCATSIVQRGKIEYYARIGKDTPAGQVIGRNGEALTDSVEILDDLNTGKAALAPLGGIGEDLAGYKGYGYATVVEILSAALQQGNFLRALSGIGPNKEKIPFHLGHFFIAIDTEAFMGLEAFKKTAGDILRDLRNSEKRLAPRESTLPAKKNTWSGRREKTAAYRSMTLFRRN